jgi:hypothetical protein
MGNKGGANLSRTVEHQNESSRLLAKAFPEYVAIRTKKNGSLWNEERLDVSINWKKFLPQGELKYIPKNEMEGLYGISI